MRAFMDKQRTKLTDKENSLTTFSRSIFFGEECDLFTEKTAGNLSVYRNNHFLGLVQSLERKFPVTRNVLSDRNFKFISREYIKENPSAFYNLDVYGEGFPEFLNKREELKTMIHIKDLAKMDWFYYNATLSETFIELPKGLFDLWEAIFADEDIDSIEIEEPLETISVQITAGQVKFKKIQHL